MSGKLNKTICTLTSYLFALALDSSGYVVCLAAKSADTPDSHSHVHIHHSQDNEHGHPQIADQHDDHHHDHAIQQSQDIAAISAHPGAHLEISILGSHLVEWRNHSQTELNIEKSIPYLPFYSVLPLNELYQFANFHPINTSQSNVHPAKQTTVLLL